MFLENNLFSHSLFKKKDTFQEQIKNVSVYVQLTVQLNITVSHMSSLKRLVNLKCFFLGGRVLKDPQDVLLSFPLLKAIDA